MAHLDASPTDDQEVGGLTLMGWQHSFMEIDHAVFSMVILSLRLIQESHLSVSGERMCLVKVWSGKLVTLNMTPFG